MIMETQNQQPAVNVYPNGNAGGFGDSSFGGGWFFWIILFFFMMFFMGGWGGRGYANDNGPTVVYAQQPNGGYQIGNEIRNGFDQAAVIGGLNTINSTLQNGFNNAEVSRCNQQANLLAQMNNFGMSLQNCCCENRAGIADVKYALATEACADRAAVTNALAELTAQNNANMNMMANMFNNGIQSLKDDFCDYRIEQKDAQIADLQRQLTFAQTSDLVNNSKNAILSNNDLQTAALEQYLAPVPRPAYVVQNPSCCNQNYSPCNCRQCG